MNDQREHPTGLGKYARGEIGGTLDARAPPTRADRPHVPCRGDDSASTVVLGFLRSCSSRSQSHRTSTIVHAKPAPIRTVAHKHCFCSRHIHEGGFAVRPLLTATAGLWVESADRTDPQQQSTTISRRATTGAMDSPCAFCANEDVHCESWTVRVGRVQ